MAVIRLLQVDERSGFRAPGNERLDAWHSGTTCVLIVFQVITRLASQFNRTRQRAMRVMMNTHDLPVLCTRKDGLKKCLVGLGEVRHLSPAGWDIANRERIAETELVRLRHNNAA
jgi:hypothetical protein